MEGTQLAECRGQASVLKKSKLLLKKGVDFKPLSITMKSQRCHDDIFKDKKVINL